MPAKWRKIPRCAHALFAQSLPFAGPSAESIRRAPGPTGNHPTPSADRSPLSPPRTMPRPPSATFPIDLRFPRPSPQEWGWGPSLPKPFAAYQTRTRLDHRKSRLFRRFQNAPPMGHQRPESAAARSRALPVPITSRSGRRPPPSTAERLDPRGRAPQLRGAGSPPPQGRLPPPSPMEAAFQPTGFGGTSNRSPNVNFPARVAGLSPPPISPSPPSPRPIDPVGLACAR